MSKSAGIVAATCLLFGGLIGWAIGSRFDPSHEEIRAAAEALLPEGATVTERGENTGHPIIVGPYFASVDFEIRGASDVDVALGQRSRALGYTTDRVEVRSAGTARWVVRKPVRAVLTGSTRSNRDGNGWGNVQVEADPESKRDRRMIGAIGGSIGLSALALLVIVWRKGYRISGLRSGETSG